MSPEEAAAETLKAAQAAYSEQWEKNWAAVCASYDENSEAGVVMDTRSCVEAVVAAVTPLIRAQVLEECARFVENDCGNPTIADTIRDWAVRPATRE